MSSERSFKVPREGGMVQCEAWCVDCGWHADAHKFWTRTEQGRRHAQRTGHEVHSEQGVSIVYNGRGDRA